MKYLAILTIALAANAADKKPLPNQAGNDNIELAGSLLLETPEISQAAGGDLGRGYVIVRIKVTPKTGELMRISPDDFVLLSRKNGERSPALAPALIVGKAGLVVKAAAEQPGGDGTRTNGPVWGGATPQQGGNNATNAEFQKALEQKMLPETDTKTGAEGLLYFALDGKLKPKDVSLVYQGRGGKLVMDFR
jgi:hypothetical protein